MNRGEFIETVEDESGLESNEAAEAVIVGTLQTLGERITDGEASDLARHVPDEFADPLADVPGEADPFPLEEFEARVADRAGIPEDEVVESVRAVATALALASEDELATAREQLPPEYDLLFEPGGPTTTEEFIEIVGDRAGLDADDAARATRATLATLGERLTGGEASDLALYLPEELAAEIVESGTGDATDYSFSAFVATVSQRTGVEKERAETHVRAVGSALADTASEREVDAARKQLPDPMGVLFEVPGEPSDG